MLRNQYNEFVKEYFDLTDRQTLKCLTSINEADQNQVLGSLAAKLYDSIVKKITDIDYGQIPLSKGDITKIPNYIEISECLTTIRDMMVERKQSTNSVDTIFTSIENLKKYKRIWEKGYTFDCEMVVIFYNTIALAIVSSTSLLISATVEFIKTPNGDYIDMELAKVANQKTKDGLLFKNLEKFNKSCKKGDIEKAFDAVLKAQLKVKESNIKNESGGVYITENIFNILFVGASIIGLLGCVIPVLHQLTNALYCLRQSVAEYLAGEADIIRLNAEKVNYNRSKTPEQKKKIIARQNKIADHFKEWSNKLMIKASKAERDAMRQIEEDHKSKSKIKDVVDDLPDSAAIF